MEFIQTVLAHIADGIDIIGVLVLLYGFAKGIFRFFKVETARGHFKINLQELQKIRCEIGVYILLALDFLIASDIIHTIFDLDRDQLMTLAVMIVMRTGIGYFLGREIDEICKDEG
ncbi:MAG: DUF1622 domain-containing protein [Bacteroidia bacterium]|jgi:uncharacterized membrane protein|tara:strand:- start:4596 stop:4943 length:348 start_codon:yes stop_codon:yes gene_type:complete